jgi:hypothetical protein
LPYVRFLTKEGVESRFPFEPQEYPMGDLRDIYPINILYDAHLERVLSFDIGSITLEKWMRADPLHGTLEPLTGTDPATLWLG